MTRTEQFLSDLFEVRKGLPRHLKNIMHRYSNYDDLARDYPQYVDRIKAHRIGRKAHTGMSQPKFDKFLDRGDTARLASRTQPGFAMKPEPPPGTRNLTGHEIPLIPPSKMSAQAQQSWRTRFGPRIESMKRRRNQPKPVNVVDWANQQVRVDPAVAARAQAAIAANQAAQQRAAQQVVQNNRARAAAQRAAQNYNAHPVTTTPAPAPTPVVHQTQAAPPPQPTYHPPAPQVQASPPPVQVHHQAPSMAPQQQVPPARQDNSRRNKWLRRSIAGSLGLGAAGGGAYTGYRSYQNQNRHPVRVRNQWEM